MEDPKFILITGASSGIGEALALQYAGPGIFLALSGRNEERLTHVSRRCIEKGAHVESAVLDVANRKAMEEWLLSVDVRYPLDLVIANAGISGGTGGVMNGEPVDQAREIFDVNLIGVLNTISPILPRMIERHKGQLAFISSMAGFRGFPSAPAYSASKGAVRFYGEALRGSLSPAGIRVSVICPGFIKSRMTDANDFEMPLLMETDKAAQIMIAGLRANKGRISFPFVMAFGVWFLALLPDFLAQKILTRLPAKGAVRQD